MSFLAPSSSSASRAIAIPVLVHLIQRERKRVIEFPSLMFVQRIPYQSVRRRRIRHWFLLLMRAAAIALIVAAFARPFFPQGAAAAAAAAAAPRGRHPARSVGEHGLRRSLAARARRRARRRSRSLGADDKATLVLFGRNAEENMRATVRSRRGSRRRSTRRRSTVGRDALRPGAEAGGEHPGALDAEAARSDARSPISREPAGAASEDVHFPEGMTLTPVSVASPDTANLVGAVGHLRARVVLRPGAHHGDRRRQQQERERRQRRAGHARDRRPSRSRPSTATVGAATRRRRSRSRSSRWPSRTCAASSRRHRPAAGRQHLPLRARAERAGVGARRRQRRPARRELLPVEGAGDRHDAGVSGGSRARRRASRRGCSTSAPVVILNDTMLPPGRRPAAR